MRFSITFDLDNKGTPTLIPINYQYLVSSWIYKVLDKGNPAVAEWLHQKGFEADRKHFRLFNFSRFNIPSARRIEDKLEIRSPRISIVLSFYAPGITEPFIHGLFRDQLFVLKYMLNSLMFRISAVEMLKEPEFMETMTYRCLSPIHIAYRNERSEKIDHLHPDHREYEKLFGQNLISKWQALHETNEVPFSINEVKLKVLTEPKKNGIVIKEGHKDATKLIGYNFDFTLQAPVELQRAGYYAGFGKANSMGFGCGELINQT